MPPRQRTQAPEFMMPVAADAAALQFFTEAMRSNTTVMEAFRDEAREDRRLLHAIHVKVEKMESHDMVGSIKELSGKIDNLEKEKDQRHGANKFGNWILDKTPSIAAIVVAVFAAVVATLKATGRL